MWSEHIMLVSYKEAKDPTKFDGYMLCSDLKKLPNILAQKVPKRLQNLLNLIKKSSFQQGAKNIKRTINIISNAQENKHILKNFKYLDSICSSLSI